MMIAAARTVMLCTCAIRACIEISPKILKKTTDTKKDKTICC
jgi:hypothetical protein